MNGNETLTRILAEVSRRRTFAKLQRMNFTSITVDDALKVVEAIGKTRNPKFVIDDANRFVYTNFIKWLHGDITMRAIDPTTGAIIAGDINKGIYIGGNTGTGKSWCVDIMREYSAAARFFYRMPEGEHDNNYPLTWQLLRAKDYCDEFATTGDIKRYTSRIVLAIQDLGTEPTETIYMGNRENVIRQMLEARGDMVNEITIITSNLKINGDTLVGTYGKRVASRLAEMCNYFTLRGEDRRRQ